jgi:hypothetical protein
MIEASCSIGQGGADMVRKDRKPSSRRNRKPPVPTMDAAAIRDMVEEQRGRLMVAGTLLDCVIDVEKASGPLDERRFPSLTEIARDLVTQSVRKLESAARDLDDYAEEMSAALRSRNEVKECRTLYLH